MALYKGNIVIDVGTGDGRFAYRSARQNPDKFYLGIDPNARPLAKISEKIYRRPAKGGASNVLFLQAAVEDLPSELDGIADGVHINFPWGSLLEGVAKGDDLVLKNLRRLCRSKARVELIIGIDLKQDQSELKRLGLPEISSEYLEHKLVPTYESNGFEIVDYGILSSSEWPKIESSWAARLCHSTTRLLIYLNARAVNVR